MMRSMLIAAAAPLVAACAASTRNATVPHPVAACYTVDAGTWMADSAGAAADSSLLGFAMAIPSFDPPRVLELTTEPYREYAGVQTFRFRTPGQPMGYTQTIWWADGAGQSVVVNWTSNGWNGYTMHLSVRGDTLTGDLRPYSDVVLGPEPVRKVRAVRTRCPRNPGGDR